MALPPTTSPHPGSSPLDQVWMWRGFPIRYQHQGTQGPVVVLIHGFGASCDHWRKNIPVLAQTHRVYVLDLLGFGRSAKPTPGQPLAYTFETWGEQVQDFCRDIVGDRAILVGNSVGCIVALQVAVTQPWRVKGLVLLNCSLRLLHDRKRSQLPWYRNWTTPLIQQILGIPALGRRFFSQLARPQTLEKILRQAYARSEAVTPDLVQLLLQPAQDPGAADVFLAFVRYSQGPLPEELLPQVTCPVLVLWGADDPWEPVALGKDLAQSPGVEHFIPLPGVGHCPQDEAPEVVNPLIQAWTTQVWERSTRGGWNPWKRSPKGAT